MALHGRDIGWTHAGPGTLLLVAIALTACYGGAPPIDETDSATGSTSTTAGPTVTTLSSTPGTTMGDASASGSTDGPDPDGTTTIVDPTTGSTTSVDPTTGGSGSGSDDGTSTGMPMCDEDPGLTYDDNTQLSWVTRATGGSTQRMRDLILLDDGRVLALGYSDSNEVILATGQPSELMWTDPTYDPFYLAAFTPTGELDWTYFIPNDGGMATTDLARRSDSTLWMGGRIDSFDESIFTWPDASTTVIDTEICFAMRISQAGELQELFTYDAESVRAVAVAPDDTLVTAGAYWSTEVFGPGEPNETVLSANGGAIDEAYIARWQVDGQLAWAISLTDGNAEDEVHALTIDGAGDLYVTGRYGEPSLGGSDPAIFGEGGAAVMLDTYGEGDGFVARLDSAGVLQWVRRFGGSDSRDLGTDIAVLPDGTIAVTGTFGSMSALFGEGEPAETTLMEAGPTSGFLARFAADGDLLWARGIGGGSFYGPTDLELTPAGDIAVILQTDSGETTTLDVDNQCTWTMPVEGEVHVLAYDIDGNLQWTRHDPSDGGIFDSDSGGVVFDGATGYMSGNFHDATFGLGEPAEAYYETSIRDAFLTAFTY